MKSPSSLAPRHAPSVTNQAPQVKNWRNIITDSRALDSCQGSLSVVIEEREQNRSRRAGPARSVMLGEAARKSPSSPGAATRASGWPRRRDSPAAMTKGPCPAACLGLLFRRLRVGGGLFCGGLFRCGGVGGRFGVGGGFVGGGLRIGGGFSAAAWFCGGRVGRCLGVGRRLHRGSLSFGGCLLSRGFLSGGGFSAAAFSAAALSAAALFAAACPLPPFPRLPLSAAACRCRLIGGGLVRRRLLRRVGRDSSLQLVLDFFELGIGLRSWPVFAASSCCSSDVDCAAAAVAASLALVSSFAEPLLRHLRMIPAQIHFQPRRRRFEGLRGVVRHLALPHVETSQVLERP